MSEIYGFMGKTNKRIYHIMSKKFREFLAKVGVKANKEISKIFSMPNDDGLVKSSNLRRANFVIVRRTYRTLNDYEMQHNAEVGLFTRPSMITIYCNMALPR